MIEKHTYNVAAVRIRAIEEHGNLLSFYQGALNLTVEDPLQLIGPDIVTLQGKMGGAYVKTTGIPGEAILRISNEQVQEVGAVFRISVLDKGKTSNII